MDFASPYSEEQQRFRQEVRTWLEENIPENMIHPVDPRDFTEEMYIFWRGKHQEMAAKGWLYPTFPKEYGGGGLTAEHETILEEESLRFKVPRFLNTNVLPSILVWGTEEQKQKFLAPLLRAEKIAWEKYTEPRSGADLAGYTSRAVRDGDDWIVTGQNAFISGRDVSRPDWLFGPLVTDPDAPRHRNLGYFMIPFPSPGLEIKAQNLLDGHNQHLIYMENVRVPGDHLIGGEGQGWQVSNTGLEQQHGGRGRAFPKDEPADNLLSYVTETKHSGGTLGSDPLIQQTTMDALLDAHVDNLLAKRTYWMYQKHMEITHEGNEAQVHNRLKTMRQANRVRDAMKMHALLDRNEPGAPHGGAQEVEQRYAAGQRHGGGSTNIAKVILARRIGISRTRERPYPTPSTATKHGS